MKKSAVVIQGVFAAASFGAAVGFCWLWRSSVRESTDASARAVAIAVTGLHAKIEDIQTLAEGLERQLEEKAQENERLRQDNEEVRGWLADIRDRLGNRAMELRKTRLELQRARAALAERDQPDKKEP